MKIIKNFFLMREAKNDDNESKKNNVINDMTKKYVIKKIKIQVIPKPNEIEC